MVVLTLRPLQLCAFGDKLTGMKTMPSKTQPEGAIGQNQQIHCDSTFSNFNYDSLSTMSTM